MIASSSDCGCSETSVSSIHTMRFDTPTRSKSETDRLLVPLPSAPHSYSRHPSMAHTSSLATSYGTAQTTQPLSVSTKSFPSVGPGPIDLGSEGRSGGTTRSPYYSYGSNDDDLQLECSEDDDEQDADEIIDLPIPVESRLEHQVSCLSLRNRQRRRSESLLEQFES